MVTLAFVVLSAMVLHVNADDNIIIRNALVMAHTQAGTYTPYPSATTFHSAAIEAGCSSCRMDNDQFQRRNILLCETTQSADECCAGQIKEGN